MAPRPLAAPPHLRRLLLLRRLRLRSVAVQVAFEKAKA
jgi:hypothetical protein